MNSTYRFTLDMHSAQSQVSIPVMLGDTGRTLRINLSDGSNQYIISDGCLAKISIKRPTGTRLEDFCTIEGNTTIVYQFTDTTCVEDGIHDCDITLYGLDGSIITSPRFSMVVSERVVRSDDIVITDTDQTAVDAMITAETARQNAENGRVSAESARANAEAERVANENERKANAESIAKSAEEAKEACESAKASEAYVSRLAPMMGQVDRNTKDIVNLKAMVDTELFATDDTTAYKKTVPTAVLPYASVDRIGGSVIPENLFVSLGAITDTSDKVWNDCGEPISLRHDPRDETIMYISVERYEFSHSFNLGKLHLPNGTYTMSGVPLETNNSTGERIWSLTLSGVETFVDNGNGVTFDWTHGIDEELSLSIAFNKAPIFVNKEIKIMLVKGSTKSKHILKGYYNQIAKVTEVISNGTDGSVLGTLKIPTEVQDLLRYDGDEVDFENRVVKSNVTSIVMPNIGWSKATSYIQNNFNTSKLPSFNTDRKTEATLTGYEYDATLSKDRTWYVASKNGFRLRDDRFATKEEFVAHLESNPLTITYVAQTASETDISELVPVDNLIRVEDGGTLTFANDTELAVPSAVTYQKEVV